MKYDTFHHLRTNKTIRDLHAEVNIQISDFIIPFFIVEGMGKKILVKGFDHVYQYTIDQLIIELQTICSWGFNKIMLFGVIDDHKKSDDAQYAYSLDSVVAKAIKQIKLAIPHVTIFADVCMCAYTLSGHCGIIENGIINNQKTLEILSKIAMNYAQVGADFVAPSAMMDGQVWAIKSALNKLNDFKTRILAYSAKYASAFYGPFRQAANSAPSFGNRKTYQLDYRTIKQALDETKADIDEGADWIMVKPAHTYLDIINRVKAIFSDKILVAYQTSGEYMMLKLLAQNGLANENEVFLESLMAIKRAGANYIITYAYKEIVQLLNG